MKTKNLVTLAVTALVVVLLTVLCLTGVQVGKYIVIPAANGIARGAEFKDNTYIVLDVNKPAQADAHDHADETSAEAESGHTDEPADADMVADTLAVLRRRADVLSVRNVTVAQQGDHSVRIEIPTDDANVASSIYYTMAEACHVTVETAAGEVIAQNADILSSDLGMNPEQTAYLLTMKLSPEVQPAWDALAASGEVVTVYLDGVEMCSVQASQILKSGIPFTNYQQAVNLLMALQTGRIEAHLHTQASGLVPATISDNVFTNGMYAVYVTTLVAAVAMLIVYRKMGFVSALSIVLCTVATIFFFGAVPYLPFGVASFFALACVVAVKLLCDRQLISAVRAGLNEGMDGKEAVTSAWRTVGIRTLEICGAAIIPSLLMQYFGAESVSAFTSVFAAGSTTALLISVLVTRPLISCVAQAPARKDQ